MATQPDHDNDVRSYPDDQQTGTTGPITGGAHHHRNGDKKPTKTPMRIARIDTVTMTAAERDNAAEALAVLYRHYQHHHRGTAA